MAHVKKSPSKKRRYYVKQSTATFEEDMTHEFKGHKNLCIEEIPKWCQSTKGEKGSRKSVSRNLCGFLNTGYGGTVYCGILDNGAIVGLTLTQYQRDHVVGSMNDLMSRYQPKVPQYRYRITFVPVLSPRTKEDEREELASLDIKETVDSLERKREHRFRTCHYCWCDKDSKAQCENGLLVSSYVIEITIKPWDPDDDMNKGLGDRLNLHPIHANEEGKIYFRRQASLVQYTLQEIANLARYEAKIRSDAVINNLKHEIALVKASIAEKQKKKDWCAISSSAESANFHSLSHSS